MAEIQEVKTLANGKKSPGYGAQEDAKRSADEQAERVAGDEPTLAGVDPRAIETDREIAQHLASPHNELEVSGALPGWRYKWVYNGLSGRFLTQARYDGWVLVQGDDPEAFNMRSVDGTRRIADVTLYRIPEEKYQALQERDRRSRLMQQEGITAELEELGRKHGILVRTEFSAQELSRMQAKAFAQKAAKKKFTDMVRSGTVPGMRMGGGRRE